MQGAIILNNWKLPVFRKRLEEAGISYQDGGSVLNDTGTVLIVETDSPRAMAILVAACDMECDRLKERKL